MNYFSFNFSFAFIWVLNSFRLGFFFLRALFFVVVRFSPKVHIRLSSLNVVRSYDLVWVFCCCCCCCFCFVFIRICLYFVFISFILCFSCPLAHSLILSNCSTTVKILRCSLVAILFTYWFDIVYSAAVTLTSMLTPAEA